MDPNASCKDIDLIVTKDLIMKMLICVKGEPLQEFINEEKLHEVLQNITLLSEKRRIKRSMKAARKDMIKEESCIDLTLKLKSRCNQTSYSSLQESTYFDTHCS